MNSSTKCLDIGKALLSNGYTPLPLVDKGIRIRGWSTADVTMQWINDVWPKNKDGSPAKRSGKYPNTGIRCDNLVAIDIDVLDEDLANEIEALVEAECGPTDFLRIGKWPKRLMLYYCEDEGPSTGKHRVRSGKYGDHQVEILMGAGCQFAAYGIHPGTKKPYEWEAKHPLEHDIDDLPGLTIERVLHVLSLIEQKFVETGIPRTKPGGLGAATGGQVNDLTDDTPIMLDGGETTWGDVKGQLDHNGFMVNLMREDGWGDSNACHAFIARGSGEPCIFDFPNDVAHWETAALDKLAEQMPEADAINMFEDPNMINMLRDWVLLSNKEVRRLAAPMRFYTVESLRQFKANEMYLDPNVADPKPVNVVTAWAKDPRAMRADFMEMRADHPDTLFIEDVDDGVVIFNSYRRPQHPDVGGEIETVFEFLNHLIPDRDELNMFLDWHASKIAHPGRRQHGLIMVTPEFGVGRGTWFQILERLCGQRYVNPVDFKVFTGQGTQSQYNDFAADSTVVIISESREDYDRASDWQHRKTAYEHVKNIIDPATTRVLIKRKGSQNTFQYTFASYILASNHVDALAIEPGDRRLIVLSNGELPLAQAPDDLMHRIHEWLQHPANIGALHRWLVDRAESITYDGHGEPMMTPAKQRMIETGQSDLDYLFDRFVESAPGDLATSYQFKMFIGRESAQSEMTLPEGNKLKYAIDKIMAAKCVRVKAIDPGGIKVDKVAVRPWAMRRKDHWRVATDHPEICKEVQKNGPVTASTTKLPTSK